ncbi:MAG: amidophosphoribosyltransferase, partial [Spirochaetales bacterium]|nr:amidophosphoribosyltransferase [Spirochaetales bacterium]
KNTHFVEMSSGEINPTELVSIIIDRCDSLVEGIKYAQSLIKGSISILILTQEGILAARDKYGRTPLIIGKKDNACCVSFESFAFLNLGYVSEKVMGPGEIVNITAQGYEVVKEAENELKICSFLWVYFGYPCSSYENISVETMRYNSGANLARRDADDDLEIDYVGGIPDSGTGCAIGYSNESMVPFARPFIKYTPTWPRSFMPQDQRARNLIAKMKLIPVGDLIKGKSLLFCDDSIVRGTQLRETVSFLYESGAKAVHVRPACPPLLFGCKYLNFSRSRSELDLITRRIIQEREANVTPEVLSDYADSQSKNHKEMVECICKELNLTSLKFLELEDLIASIGLPCDSVCTYCWNGKE